MYAPNVPLPVAGSSWKVPGYSHPDTPALLVLDGILTAGESSRLYRALVHDRQVASQVGGQYGMVEETGFYAPLAFAASGKSVAELEAVLAEEIARVRSEPVTAAELAEAKNELLAEALRDRETAAGRASGLGEALVRTGDARAWDKQLAAIRKVSAADVQRVARKYLAPEARVDLRYLNESERPQGQADGWTNPVAMPAFKTVPPAVKPAVVHASDAEREAPPAPGTAVPVTPPVISQTRLANGLEVIAAKSGDVPLATMFLVVKGGSSTDPRDKAGLASLAADLATKGTPTRSGQQIAAELESLGAQIGSGAGNDGAYLSVTAPAENLPAAGRILADIVRNATFPAEDFEREKKKALDGLSVAMKNPGTVGSMVMTAALFGDAPYGAMATGTPTTLARLTRDDLARHHRRWWHPGNSALIVSGGMDPARANALAAELFGGWRGEGPAPQPPAERAGEARAPRTIVVDMPGAGQAAVSAESGRSAAQLPNIIRCGWPTRCSAAARPGDCSRRSGPSGRCPTAPTAISSPAPTRVSSAPPPRPRTRARRKSPR